MISFLSFSQGRYTPLGCLTHSFLYISQNIKYILYLDNSVTFEENDN